jgi:hypothetical protein
MCLIGKGLKRRGITGGSGMSRGNHRRFGREREETLETTAPTGGVSLAVRERERERVRGWAGSAGAGLLPGFGPRVRPSWAGSSFFCSDSFLFSVFLFLL